MDTNHPIHNPKYNKVDYIRNGIFNVAKAQFALLLEEGCSLQQLGLIANQLQGAIARAYVIATGEVVTDFAGDVPEPPQWNIFPDAPGEPPEGFSGPNPFTSE